MAREVDKGVTKGKEAQDTRIMALRTRAMVMMGLEQEAEAEMDKDQVMVKAVVAGKEATKAKETQDTRITVRQTQATATTATEEEEEVVVADTGMGKVQALVSEINPTTTLQTPIP